MRRGGASVGPPVSLSAAEIAFVKALVIWEDRQILALNKPSGLSSQGGRGQVHTLDELLWAFARPGRPRPRLLHRLDRDTSGVILAARTQPAASFVGKAIMARRLAKTYLALTSNSADVQARGRVEMPLRREEIGREAYMRICGPEHPSAQSALTDYRLLGRTEEAALIEAQPTTGRMHQIRVHLAGLGAPILGDARYGGALSVGGRPIPRLMLHALAVTFPHPEGGETTIRADPPDDFSRTARDLSLGLQN